MYRKTREELISDLKKYGSYDDECERFYLLPHSEKAREDVFEKFCEKHSGYAGIVLSDDEICDNKRLVLLAKKHGFYEGFHLLSERLLNDPEVALALADCNHYEYTKISKSIRSDADLMLAAVRVNPGIYCSLPVKVKADKRIVMEIAAREPWQLKKLLEVRRDLREPIQRDKELALIATNRYPDLLIEFFATDLLCDKEIQEVAFHLSNEKEMKNVLRKNVWALPYVDVKFWGEDRSLIKSALKQDGNLLRYLPESYKKDKEIVLIAVKNAPDALEFCDSTFYNDREVIMASLHDDSEEMLRFASERLKSDYDVVYRAVAVDALNLQYASDELRDNKDIVIRALRTYGGVLDDASARLQLDRELQELAKKNM